MLRNKIIKIGAPIVIVFCIAAGLIYNSYVSMSPLRTFNEDGMHTVGYGWVEAREELGTIMLDDTTCLFLGDVDDTHFVIAEMKVKNGKYKMGGAGSVTYLCDTVNDIEGISVNKTRVADGYVEWSVLYHDNDIKQISKLDNVAKVEKFAHSGGQRIYIVIYE